MPLDKKKEENIIILYVIFMKKKSYSFLMNLVVQDKTKVLGQLMIPPIFAQNNMKSN